MSGLECGDGIRAGPPQDSAWASIYGLHGLVDDGPCDIFSFLFSFFGLVLLDYIPIFLYFYILLRRRFALRFNA
jgi:hypothetical protein